MSGGMGLILIACILSIGQLVPTMSRVSIADWSFPLMSLLYCIMMFASSYVEEEHHFWYWMASAWFMALFFKQYGFHIQFLFPGIYC
jgi:ethanolaminephosphotransferase